MTRTTQGLGTVLFAAAVLAAVPSTGASAVVDSFTEPFRPNPLLPATGRRILFLGPYCDGDQCPPSSVVVNTSHYDSAGQAGLAGVLGGERHTELGADQTCCEIEGILRIDPAGSGTLIFTPRAKPLYFSFAWGAPDIPGAFVGEPLNLDLTADGSDRFEVDILALIGSVRISIELTSYDGGGDFDGFASAAITATDPTVVSIPLASFGTAYAPLSKFADDIDLVRVAFYHASELADLVIGEVRFAGTPVPAATSSWGRLKSTYRR